MIEPLEQFDQQKGHMQKFPFRFFSKARDTLTIQGFLQGMELTRLRKQRPYKRIIYLGDGANDLCPALRLQPQDMVMARKGYDLDRLIQERKKIEPHCMSGQVKQWSTHAELFQLVKEYA